MSADATRAALPRRPMLGAVLDALTVPVGMASRWLAQPFARIAGADADGIRVVFPKTTPDGYAGDTPIAWVTTNVAEAYELLQARDLVPMGYVGRFVCERCQGVGIISDVGTDLWPSSGKVGCSYCAGTGHRPHPPTVAALASWASLGFATSTDDDADDRHWSVPAAEALARELNDGAEVRWQVAPRTSSATPGVTWPPAIEALWSGGLDVLRGHTRTVLYVPPLGLVTP